MSDVPQELIDAAAKAIAEEYVIYGNLYGRAIAVGDDTYREIARCALAAVADLTIFELRTRLCILHGLPLGPSPSRNCPECRVELARTLADDSLEEGPCSICGAKKIKLVGGYECLSDHK